jgi:hypothetical protein
MLAEFVEQMIVSRLAIRDLNGVLRYDDAESKNLLKLVHEIGQSCQSLTELDGWIRRHIHKEHQSQTELAGEHNRAPLLALHAKLTPRCRRIAQQRPREHWILLSW